MKITRESYAKRRSLIWSVHQILVVDDFQGSGMGGTCNTYGVAEKCTSNFSQEARKEENSLESVQICV